MRIILYLILSIFSLLIGIYLILYCLKGIKARKIQLLSATPITGRRSIILNIICIVLSVFLVSAGILIFIEQLIVYFKLKPFLKWIKQPILNIDVNILFKIILALPCIFLFLSGIYFILNGFEGAKNKTERATWVSLQKIIIYIISGILILIIALLLLFRLVL